MDATGWVNMSLISSLFIQYVLLQLVGPMIIMGDPARNGTIGLVTDHYSLVVHDAIVLGHHGCVDDGSQLVAHDHGLEGDHFRVGVNISPCV